MKHILPLTFIALLLVPLAAPKAADTITIPVDSPAFAFSPGNWTGDEGRAGKGFRQTWNPYAYFRVAWETKSDTPQANILLDTSSYSTKFQPPLLAYNIDGVWKSKIPCTNEVVIGDITGAGRHVLSVYHALVGASRIAARWRRPWRRRMV